MEGKHVNAILSDYDGTLCPTTSVRDDDRYGVGGTIPTGQYFYGLFIEVSITNTN
jgi:hypothetical protein